MQSSNVCNTSLGVLSGKMFKIQSPGRCSKPSEIYIYSGCRCGCKVLQVHVSPKVKENMYEIKTTCLLIYYLFKNSFWVPVYLSLAESFSRPANQPLKQKLPKLREEKKGDPEGNSLRIQRHEKESHVQSPQKELQELRESRHCNGTDMSFNSGGKCLDWSCSACRSNLQVHQE